MGCGSLHSRTMRLGAHLAIVVVGLLGGAATCGRALAGERIRLESNVTFGRFEQAVQQGHAGPREGSRIVEEMHVGWFASGAYRLHDHFAVGLFARYDVGVRRSGTFRTFDAEGRAQIDRVGGTNAELWLGPIVRGHLGFAFLELGWAPFAIRTDTGRADLPNERGESDGTFRSGLTPFAWLVGLGAEIPLGKTVLLLVRYQYRNRYFLTRGGAEMTQGAAHGSQDHRPFLGFGFRL